MINIVKLWICMYVNKMSKFVYCVCLIIIIAENVFMWFWFPILVKKGFSKNQELGWIGLIVFNILVKIPSLVWRWSVLVRLRKPRCPEKTTGLRQANFLKLGFSQVGFKPRQWKVVHFWPVEHPRPPLRIKEIFRHY